MVTKNKDDLLPSPTFVRIISICERKPRQKKNGNYCEIFASYNPSRNILVIYFVFILISFTLSKTGFDF